MAIIRALIRARINVKVSASLTNVGSMAVGAFDLLNCSLVSMW